MQWRSYIFCPNSTFNCVLVSGILLNPSPSSLVAQYKSGCMRLNVFIISACGICDGSCTPDWACVLFVCVGFMTVLALFSLVPRSRPTPCHLQYCNKSCGGDLGMRLVQYWVSSSGDHTPGMVVQLVGQPSQNDASCLTLTSWILTLASNCNHQCVPAASLVPGLLVGG